MSLLLRIVDPKGVARAVEVKPGDRIQLAPGDVVTVVDPAQGATVRVERIGNDLVIVYAEGRVLLGSFFPSEPVPGPQSAAALKVESAAAGTALPTLIFENADGVNIVNALGSSVASSGSGELFQGGGPLPETFELPENTAAQRGTASGEPLDSGLLDAENPLAQQPDPIIGPQNDTGLGVPVFQFQVASVETREGGILVFTIARSGGTQPAAVTITTASGTAIQGADFSDYSSGTFSFASGEMTKTLTILALPDNILEGSETFSVVLSNPTNGAQLGSLTTSTGVIKDPSFTISSSQASEGGAVTFTVTRDGDAPGPQTVEYSTFDATATTTVPSLPGLGNFDYNPVVGALTFSQGETAKTFTVDLTDDAVFDDVAPETFGVTLTNAAGGALIDSGFATGTILDNDAAPTFAISGGETDSEGGGALVYTVTRTGDAERPQTVQIGTGGGTATPGADYVPNATVLTFTQGETTKTFTVVLNEDARFEIDESVGVTLSNPSFGSITVGSAEGTINDNDPVPMFSVDGSGASAFEGDGIVFTITRSTDADVPQAITVTTALTAGDNAGAADFTPVATAITFNQGELTRTFTVQTTEDLDQEGGETFSVTLSNATNDAVIDPAGASAQGLIIDDDISNLIISDTSVDEGGDLVFTVIRTLNAPGATHFVEFSVLDGSASTADGDYTPVAAGTLTFADGVLAQPITVPTNPDTTFEFGETVRVVLSNPTTSAGLPPEFASGAATVTAFGTIQNDDPEPSISIAVDPSTTPADLEDGNIVFNVVRSAGAAPNQLVQFSAVPGTVVGAAGAGDFTANSGTLTFTGTDLTESITVTVIDDTTFDSATLESLTVTLGATNFGTVSTATAVGQIEDDDPTPEYSLAVSGSANEGNPGTPGAYTFTITRDRLSDETQVVDFSTVLAVDPNAAAGTDIAGGFTTTGVTFSANQLTRTVVVNAVSDNAFEANEVFLGSLSGSGNYTIDAAATTAVATITNDDPAPTYNISVSAPADEGDPGTAGAYTFTITRDRLSTETQVVGFSTAQAGGANAAEPEDLAAGTFDVTPLEVTFAPGQLSQTVVVNAQADDRTEVDEIFFGSLTTVAGGGTLTLGTATVATATILSDDPDPIYTLSVNGPLPEDVTGVASIFTFTITRTRSAEDQQSVDFATVLGGGPNDAEGTDFGQVAATTVTFLPTDGLTKTVTVVTNPDTQYEVDGTNRDEGFRGVITNPQGGAVLGGATVATAIITDNDPGPQFAVTNSSANEGDGIEFTVTRTGDAESVQTVRFVAMTGGSGNTAESGDFSPVTGTLTFNPGDTSQNFTVPTSPDALFEFDEVFLVSLFSATNGAVISAATAQGTILNEDPTPIFNIADTSEDEDGGALVFTVTRTNDAAEPQTVEIGLAAGGSATAGADYVDITTATTLAFTQGQTSATFTVALLDDTLQEGLENVLVTLANPLGGALLGTDTATGTIVDDDIPTYRIEPVAVSASEAATATFLTFTITRTLDSTVPQTVDFSIVSGTAILGTDTSPVSPLTVLTFTQGQLTRTFEVEVTNDSIFELDETITASISNAQGGAAGANIDPAFATATGTILDNDPVPSFSVADAQATEGGNIVFTVTRSTGNAQPTQTVTINSLLSGGAQPVAAEATDFSVTSQVLTFTQGETAKTFTVSTTGDTVDEPDETFLVSLTSATNGATIATATAVGTVLDNDNAPTFSIQNVTEDEGAAGTNGVFTFAVVRTGNAEATQVVNYATALGGSGNPAESTDFVATTLGAALTWTSTDVGALATKTFTVQATGDDAFESDETFLVTLTGDPLTATAATATLATGTINNDDLPPVYSLALAPAAANEGNSGAGGAFTFTITRNRSSDDPQVVNFSTTGVGANPAETGDLAGGFATNMGVTFTAGQVTSTVVVNAQADTDFEGSETFLGSLSAGSGTLVVNPAANAATATITTDDTTPPVYNLVSVSAPAPDSEGDAGTGGAVTFTIARNIRSDDTQVVNFSTALAGGATAAEAGDLIGGFTTTAVTFGAADLTRTVVVNAAGDLVFEGNEIFLGSLTTAAGGGSLTLGTGTLLTGSIDDNEVAPVYNLVSVTAPAPDSEGNSGTGGAVTFTITRNILSEETQVVTLRTASAGGSTGAEGSDLIGGFGDTAVTFGASDLNRTVVVNAAGDTTFEGNEFFVGSLLTAAGGGSVTIGTSTLLTATIDDDDTAPTLAIGTAVGIEGAAGTQGVLTFTVTRTGNAEAAQTVEYADITPAAAKPATAVDDYATIAPGTLTFTPGQTTAILTVATVQDDLLEGAETVLVSLSNSRVDGVLQPGSITGATGTGTIGDDDAPLYTISSPGVAEGVAGTGGVLTFSVVRNKSGIGQTVVVDVGVTGSTATPPGPGADYTNPALGTHFTLTFSSNTAAGSDGFTRTFTVAATGDTLFENDETVLATLSDIQDVGGGGIGGTVLVGTGTGTLTNDDLPAPAFSVTAAAANEGPAGIVFTVTRSRDAQPDQAVRFFTTDNTAGPSSATAGTDYTAVDTVLTFTQGQLSRTVTVAVTNDNLFELPEAFTVSLATATGGATIATPSVTGTINNDTAGGNDPVPVYSIAGVAATEESNAIVFTVSRTGNAQATQFVSYTTVAGTASQTPPNADYLGDAGTLTFTAGETSRTFTVLTNDDDLFEGGTPEAFTAVIGTLSSGMALGNATATATIADNDNAPTFAIADVNGNEGTGANGVLTFAVVRTGNSQANQVVNYTTALDAGGADPAEATDFLANANALTWTSTDVGALATKTFTVQLAQDTTFESNETFRVVLSGAANATATGTIDNDDGAPVYTLASVSAAPLEGAGATGGAITFTIARNRLSDETQAVNFSTSLATGSTAAEGSDLVGGFETTAVTFGSTELTRTVVVNAAGDTVFEGNEIFLGSLTTVAGGGSLTLGTATLLTGTIAEDDNAPVYNIAAVSGPATEGDTATGGAITFTIVRDRQSETSQTVNLSIAAAAGVTAAEAGDLIGGFATTAVTFAPAETTRTVVVNATGDTVFEGDEIFLGSLTTAAGGGSVTMGTSTLATATIDEDETAPSLSITATATGIEAGTPLVFTVTRNLNGATSVEGVHTVVASTSPGTAGAGTDYTTNTQTLIFTGSETAEPFTVATVDNLATESPENFFVSLTNPQINGVAGGTITNATGTGIISDNDVPVYSISSPTIGEGGTLTFAVIRDKSDIPQTIRVDLSNGTASNGDHDPFTTPQTLNFTSQAGGGPQTLTFTVDTVQDTVFEGDETIFATLSNVLPASPGGSIDVGTGTGTIQNDDPIPTVTIAQTTAGDEPGGPGNGITFTVTRNLNGASSVQDPQTVTVNTANGGANPATADDDYTTVTNLVLTFTGTQTTQTFTVPVLDDPISEGTETVLATLASLTGGLAAGTATLATGTINDDEPPPAFSVTSVSVPEGAAGTNGVLTFAIVRSATAASPQVINYATALDTLGADPAEGTDFSANSSAVTFTSLDVGVSTRTFTVQATGDNVFEGDETFLVNLTGAFTDTAIGTIQNDELPPAYNLSLAPAAANEGNAGTGGAFIFTITRNRSSEETQVVNFSTAAAGANGAETGDLVGGFLTNFGVTFTAGQLTQTVTVNAAGDTDFEVSETFLGSLTTAAGGGSLTLGTATVATATITTDDTTPPVYTLASVTAPAPDSEGDAGTGGAVTFTITRNIRSEETQVVNFSTALAGGATAAEGTDLIGGFATTAVTFAPTETTRTVVVNAAGDTVFEGNEVFLGTLTTAAGGGSLSLSASTLLTATIDDDDNAPIYNLTAVSGPATEGNTATGGAITFTIVRDRLSEADQVVTLRTDAITADAGPNPPLDLVGGFGNRTATFGASDLTRTVVVNAVGDTLFEGAVNETFGGTLTTVTGGGTLGAITTQIAEIDDDDTAPQLAITGATGTEGNTPSGAFMTFVVNRIGNAEAVQTVNFTTYDLTPAGPGFAVGDYTPPSPPFVAGADYVGNSGVLTFTQGQTTATFSVQMIGDTDQEGIERFGVSLSGPNFGTISGAGTATGEITDDDVPAFSINSTTATEGAPLTFSVTRTLPGLDQQIVVNVTAGSATAGTDYTVPPGNPITLSFTGSEAVKPFTVATTDDGAGNGPDEPNETIFAALGTITGGNGGSIAAGGGTGTGTIEDDDGPASVSIAATTAGSEPGTAVTFTVTRTGSAAGTQTVLVNATTGGGNPAAGGDFSSTLTTLTFTSADASGATRTFTVGVNNDTTFELQETVLATLSGESAGLLVGTRTATGLINDNDPTPTFSVANAQANEGTGIVFTVTRSSGDVQPTQMVTINSLLSGGAQPGAAESTDFSVTSQVLTFTQGETQKTFTVGTTGDTVDEPDETFLVSLSGATNGATIPAPTATGTINDNDSAPTFSIANVSVGEGDPGTNGVLTFAVVRSGNSETDQVVTWSASASGANNGDTAAEPGDISAGPAPITFTSTDVGALATKTFTVQAVGDEQFEPNETFQVVLGGAASATATGTINNDEPAPTFTVSDASASETGVLTFTVTRAFPASVTSVEGPQVVNYAASDGTATLAAGDYDAASASVTFAVADTTRTFTVSPNNDAVFENPENFRVVISGQGTPSTGTGTITEDDAPPVVSIAAAASATEGSAATFTVTRDKVTQDAHTVVYSTALGGGGDQAEGTDFTGATLATFTFGAGLSTGTFTVATANDTIYENDENFLVQLNSTNFGTLNPAASSATGTVVDNEPDPVFTVSNPTAAEGSNLTFTVTRTLGTSTNVEPVQTVTIATGNGSAIEPDDYAANSAVLTFTGTETTETFVVSTVNDPDPEGNETVLATLTGPTGGAVLGATAVGTGTIPANDVVTYSIQAAAGSEGTAITFAVVRSGPSAVDHTLTYRTAGGITTGAPGTDAAEAGDFTAIASGTLVFLAADPNTKTFVVNTVEDTVFELNETFLASLTTVTGGALISTATAVGTINEDEPPPAFNISAASANEGNGGTNGVLTFSVTRSFSGTTTSAEPVQTVTVSTTNGTATAPTDYTAIAGQVLTFTTADLAGAVRTFTVQSVADSDAEANETFNAVLATPTGSAVIGTGSAIGTITNDDISSGNSLDLSTLNGTNGFRLNGVRGFSSPNAGDQSGYSVARAGDVNGDGFADLVIGARYGDNLGANGSNPGESYVFFGKASGFAASVELATFNGTSGARISLSLYGATNVRTGSIVSGIGDLNGDGLSDIMLSGTSNDYYSGRSYVVYGNSNGASLHNFDLLLAYGARGFRVRDPAPTEASAQFVATAGDVNGDGFDDTIFGQRLADPGARANAGQAFVVFGSTKPFNGAALIDPATLNGTNGFVLNGVAAGDHAGRSVGSAGDINGDGFEDIVVGAPYGQANDAGSVYVVFGKAGGFAASTELSALGTLGFTLNGGTASEHAGFSVARAGDVNSDGFGDLIIGDRDGGSAYVVFGRATGLSGTISLGALDGTNGFKLVGAAADNAGFSVAGAGDVNGDGFDDVLVGAPLADPSGKADAGATYLVLGGASFGATVNLGSAALTLIGAAAQERSGTSVSSAGDINRDGFDDIAIGAPLADPGARVDAGQSYVVFGSDITGLGNAPENLTGTGGADALVGGLGADTLDGAGGADSLRGGAGDDVLIFRGSERLVDGGSGTDTLRFSGAGQNVTMTGLAGNKVTGFEIVDLTPGSNTLTLTPNDIGQLSPSTNTLRVDGDALDAVATAGWTQGADTVIGSQTYAQYTKGALTLQVDTDIDRSQIVTNQFRLSTINGTNGVRFFGAAATDNAGFAVGAAGDMNGDGFDDIIVTAQFAEPSGPQTQQGAVYVIYGKASGFSATGINLNTASGANGFTIYGDANNGRIGYSVGSAGDVNGDGFSDIIVSSDSGNNPTTGGGRAFVVFGGTSIANLDLGQNVGLLNGTNGFTIDRTGVGHNSAFPQFPKASAVGGGGDVNGDGFDDVIVGLPTADLGSPIRDDVGEAFVIYGKATFSATVTLGTLAPPDGAELPGRSTGSPTTTDNAGAAVAVLGDINGDGRDDVAVGAPFFSGVGQTHVVLGNTPDNTVLSNTTLTGANGFNLNGTSRMGFSLDAAGDVNGDGLADMIVGAPYSSAGSAFVVFGTATPATLDGISVVTGLNGTRGFSIDGFDAGGRTGFSVSGAGDINGDGFDDLIVGATRFGALGAYAGQSYLIYGKANWSATPSVDLSQLDGVNGFSIAANGTNDYSGRTVSGAGDVNGDGYQDLMVSGHKADPATGSDAGEAYLIFGRNFRGDTGYQEGGAGNDPLTGTAAAETLVGKQGNDTLTGGGGADVLLGGAGNDTLVATGAERRVDGGSGTDTLRLAGVTLDFTSIANNKFFGIEKIDLKTAGNNVLTLNVQDVLDLTDSGIAGLPAGLAANTNVLVVNGNAGDTVNSTGQSWVNSGTVSDGSLNYTHYTSGIAHLLIEQNALTLNIS